MRLGDVRMDPRQQPASGCLFGVDKRGSYKEDDMNNTSIRGAIPSGLSSGEPYSDPHAFTAIPSAIGPTLTPLKPNDNV